MDAMASTPRREPELHSDHGLVSSCAVDVAANGPPQYRVRKKFVAKKNNSRWTAQILAESYESGEQGLGGCSAGSVRFPKRAAWLEGFKTILFRSLRRLTAPHYGSL
jgi:hypothetical protein